MKESPLIIQHPFYTERVCEAPQHVEACDGVGSTKDHFTPRAIAKLLRWTRAQLLDPDNIQYLSESCHREKDSSTPGRIEDVMDQMSGQTIFLGQHKT